MNKIFDKYYVIAGAILFLLGVSITLTSFSWKYYTSTGPGPGFFPCWIGILLSGLGVILTLVSLKNVRKGRVQVDISHNINAGEMSLEPLFKASQLKNVGLVIGALVFCLTLLKWLGFILTISFLSLFLLQIVGKWGWLKSILLSVLTSLILYLAFKVWFHIPLPAGILRF